MTISLLIISMLFSACGAKKPFEPQKPMAEAALVYVYVVQGESSGENAGHSTYQIRINGKTYLERIETGEHMILNVKPSPTLFSAVKNQIMEEHIKLDLKAGDVNYLRITDNVSYGEYGFDLVSSETARSEIAKTGLAGSIMESPDNIITELIGLEGDDDSLVDSKNKMPALTEAQIDAIIEKKLAQRQASKSGQTLVEEKSSSFTPSLKAKTKPTISRESKMDKIKEAYEMKEQGIITDEEFQALKADILAK